MNQSLSYVLEPSESIFLTFSFRTDNQVAYEIRFRPSDYLFPTLPEFTGSVFEFVLALIGNPDSSVIPLDPRIAPTVVGAIDQFLQADPMRVVTYICDSSDRREVARKRKFDQWFAAFDSPIVIKQEGQLVDIDGLTFFIAAIWQANHPLTRTISSAFQELSDSYNADKPE